MEKLIRPVGPDLGSQRINIDKAEVLATWRMRTK